jgi:2-polyprenyl-3-methyl-5-hydroxy-6-metoxy-1,4-benzoquinol methylase
MLTTKTRFWAGLGFAAVLICTEAIRAQTREEVEARLAQLPPDQRAYERFRFWVTTQREDVQRAPDVMDRYRRYLAGEGFKAADIDNQIQLVNSRGDALEVERWNRILTAEKPAFNTEPNAFLVDMVKGRTPGTALDVGMGQGRNAIWLAKQGWDVTGFDPADKAVALARKNADAAGLRLKSEITTEEKFDFGTNQWDLILLSYVGGREIHEKVEKALKPHGVVILEAFHRDATKGHSIGRAVVFDTWEVVSLFPNLRVVRYEEPMALADFGNQRVRVVRYCGEKPE